MDIATVKNLIRMLAMGLGCIGQDRGKTVMNQIKRLPAEHSAHPQRPKSISQKLIALFIG